MKRIDFSAAEEMSFENVDSRRTDRLRLTNELSAYLS